MAVVCSVDGSITTPACIYLPDSQLAMARPQGYLDKGVILGLAR